MVDPRDANSVYVCAVGQAFRTQRERGVFHTTDGGATWQQALAVDENTGCSDLAMDPGDSKTLYAGMWQLIVHRDDLNSGGLGSGVYVTRDGGATWSKVTGHDLPAADHPLGKTAVAVAPSNPSRVYALVQDAPAPGLYRSSDRGETWELVNQSHLPGERSPYYENGRGRRRRESAVLPLGHLHDVARRRHDAGLRRAGGEAEEPPVGAGAAPERPRPARLRQAHLRAAATAPPPQAISAPGGDNHDRLEIDPDNANRVLVANDARPRSATTAPRPIDISCC